MDDRWSFIREGLILPAGEGNTCCAGETVQTLEAVAEARAGINSIVSVFQGDPWGKRSGTSESSGRSSWWE